MGKIVLTKEGEDWTVSDLRRGLVKKTDGVFEGAWVILLCTRLVKDKETK